MEHHRQDRYLRPCLPLVGALELLLQKGQRRRARGIGIVRQADANNRLEGIFRDPATDVVVEAYVRGEIPATEMLPRMRTVLGRR